MANFYTLFVDKKDGGGFYRDYKRVKGALRAHRDQVKLADVTRSWVVEYADDDRDYSRVVVDWRRDMPNTSGRIGQADAREAGR